MNAITIVMLFLMAGIRILPRWVYGCKKNPYWTLLITRPTTLIVLFSLAYFLCFNYVLFQQNFNLVSQHISSQNEIYIIQIQVKWPAVNLI